MILLCVLVTALTKSIGVGGCLYQMARVGPKLRPRPITIECHLRIYFLPCSDARRVIKGPELEIIQTSKG